MEASIAEKCLEFARDINQNNKMFSFNLKFSNGFNFKFSTVEKRNTLHKNEQKMKKPSPSTLRRNRKRMQEFIEKKKSSSNDTASAEATGESSKLPPGETTQERASGEPSDVPLVYKDNLEEDNKCEECGFKARNKHGLKTHINKQHVIPQLDGPAEANTDKGTSPEGETLNEEILMLKLDLEYWTWPQNKPPPPKVHHPLEGLGISPNLYTDALGFDQISYRFKTGVCDVFEIT